MSDRVQVRRDFDVAPLGAQHPRAGDESRIEDVKSLGRMGAVAGFEFVAGLRRTHRHDLGLLGGNRGSIRGCQNDRAAGQGFFRVDRFDERDPGFGQVGHGKEYNA